MTPEKSRVDSVDAPDKWLAGEGADGGGALAIRHIGGITTMIASVIEAIAFVHGNATLKHCRDMIHMRVQGVLKG